MTDFKPAKRVLLHITREKKPGQRHDPVTRQQHHNLEATQTVADVLKHHNELADGSLQMFKPGEDNEDATPFNLDDKPYDHVEANQTIKVREVDPLARPKAHKAPAPEPAQAPDPRFPLPAPPAPKS